MISHTILKTSLMGDLLLVAKAGGLIGVYFRGCEHAPEPSPDWKFDPACPVLQQAGKQLGEYLAGTRAEFSVPVCHAGTEFQNKIWQQIAGIPFGETITYTELAGRAGAPDAVRAAGTATGRNPLSIIIPCHRVVGKDGGTGGYAGGLNRKRRLLELETNQQNRAGVAHD